MTATTPCRLSNAAVLLLDRLLRDRTPQVAGSWFQDAVAVALDGMPQYAGCYGNRGAGQPDIKAGDTGFEVKTTAGASIELDGNYKEIRRQFKHFRLVAMRTEKDMRPYHLWVIDMPEDPPTRVVLETRMDARTPLDGALTTSLAKRLSELIAAAGVAWTDAASRDEGCRMLLNAKQPSPPAGV